MGDFTQAHQLLCRAHDRVRSQCPDQPGLLTAARMYLGSALYYLGEYRALAAQSSEWISEAQTREDHYAYAALSGYGFGFLRHLMRDDAAAALAELSRAIQPWPEEPFSTNHMGISHGTLLSCLWTGGPKALSWFERNQERLARASVLKAPTPKLQIVRYRANAYLAAMTEEVTERNATLRKGVAVQLKLLETLRSPFAPAHAALIRAALLAVDRRTEQALESARAANALFTKLNLQRGEPAAFLEGWLEGGAAGRAKCDAELAALRAEGWSDPMRWVSTLLPIFHLVPRA